MQDYLPCPGCHTPLPPEATGCQICMRARSKYEITRGYARLREAQARRRRLPFQLAAAVLVLGAAAKLSFDHRARISAAVSSSRAAAGAWLEEMGDPSRYAARRAPSEPAAVNPADLPPELPARAATEADTAAGAAPAEAAREAAPAEAPKPPVAANQWRVSGTVYDLATLEPVPDAEVTFLRDGRRPSRARTDRHGRYEVDLAKGEGWTVSLRSPNHRPGQVLDLDPPYRVRDRDERRAAHELITGEDLSPAPVGWKRASSEARLDLVAVPPSWPD